MKERAQEFLQQLSSVSRRRMLWSLFIVGVATRVAFVVLAPDVGDPHSMDSQNYLRIAENIVTESRYAIHERPTPFVAPGYPFFVAALFFLFGFNVFAIKLAQVVLGGLTAVLTMQMAEHVLPRHTAWAAGGIVALHPELIALTGFIYTEVLFIFLLIATMTLLFRALETDSAKLFLAAGTLFGLSTLCRGTTLYFPVFMLLVALLSIQRRRWIVRIAMIVCAMAVVMLPWVVRNYQQFNVFLPVATGGGDVFWTGNYLPFDGEFRYEATQKLLNDVAGDVDLVTRDRILMQDAKARILRAPMQHLWLGVKKFSRFWLQVYENVPRGEAREKNWALFLVLASTHFVLLLSAIIGLRTVDWQHIGVIVLTGFATYYALLHAVTLAVPRYRLPVIPVVAIFAAKGLWQIGSGLLGRRRASGF